MNGKDILLAVWTFMILVISALGVENDLTIDINPGARECFFQNVNTGVEIEVEYQVIDGGDLDVNFMIQSPSGRILVTEVRKMEGLHTFHAEESGEFQFCIDNTFSRFSNKVVFFELVLYGVEEEDTDDGDADTEENIYEIKLDDIRSALDRVMERLKKSSTTQNVLRAIESRDRSIQENNFERVNMWSGIQIFVMISVALTHVLMIRGLFSDHSKSRHTRMAT